MADIKRIPLLIVFLIILFPSLYADDCFHVVDEGNQEVKGAVVTACDTISNKIIEVSVTDEAGKACFAKHIKPSDCIIVTAPGYVRYMAGYQDCERTIKISHDATELNEVTVYADKDQLSQKGGALVFTPGSLKTEVSNIFDLVKYVPLINYQNGAFAIVGRPSNAMIKINGMNPRDWGAGLYEALQALPATMVKHVEVSPSSGSAESASFNGGIINIVIDMPDEGILNRANVSVDYQREFSTGESYWIGWKYDRFRGSANFRFSNSSNNNESECRYGFPDMDKFVKQSSKNKSSRQAVNGSINMSYLTSQTGVIGIGIGASSGHQWELSHTSGTTEIQGESQKTEFSRQSCRPWHIPSYGLSTRVRDNESQNG